MLIEISNKSVKQKLAIKTLKKDKITAWIKKWYKQKFKAIISCSYNKFEILKKNSAREGTKRHKAVTQE